MALFNSILTFTFFLGLFFLVAYMSGLFFLQLRFKSFRFCFFEQEISILPVFFFLLSHWIVKFKFERFYSFVVVFVFSINLFVWLSFSSCLLMVHYIIDTFENLPHIFRSISLSMRSFPKQKNKKIIFYRKSCFKWKQ